MFFIKKLFKMGHQEPQSSKIEARQTQFRIHSDLKAGACCTDQGCVQVFTTSQADCDQILPGSTHY